MTTPLPGCPSNSQPCNIAPLLLENSTGWAGKFAGGFPIGQLDGATRTLPMFHTKMTPRIAAAKTNAPKIFSRRPQRFDGWSDKLRLLDFLRRFGEWRAIGRFGILENFPLEIADDHAIGVVAQNIFGIDWHLAAA